MLKDMQKGECCIMANRGRKLTNGVKNTISSVPKRKTTPWLANAIKSIGLTTADVFNDISPNLYDITSESVKSVSQLSKSVRGARGGNSVTSALQGNRYIKASQDLVKNTIADLRSGNFNNKDRETEAFMGSMEDFDAGTFFDDWDIDDGTSVQINNFDSGMGSGFTIAIDDSMRKSAEAQLKGHKANIDAMVAISSAQMLQQQELNNQIIGHLGNISSGINALVEFNNSTLASFIEASTAYMERLGAKVDEAFSYGSDKVDPASVYRNANGGFNVSTYKNLVGQNIQSYYKGSTVGFVDEFLKDNLNLLTANPLGMITKFALTQVTLKTLKKSLEALDESIAGFMPTILAKIADMGDDTGFGFGATLRRTIGKIFGVKNRRINEFDLENKITDKAVPFDQITRHTITEIIPKYLREQTSYLEAIARNMGVNTSRARENAEAFDFQRGKYRSMRNIREDIYGDIRNTTISKFDQSKFGTALREKAYGNNRDREMYNNMLDDFFVALERHGGFLNIEDQSKNSDLDQIIRGLNYSGNMQNYLRAALKKTTKDPNLALNANAAIQQSISARSKLIQNMTEDPTAYNLYAADLGNTIDEGISKIFKSSIGDPDKQKTGTLNEIMNDVRFLLNRGINVRIDGPGRYGDIGKSRSTGKSTENKPNRLSRAEIKENGGKSIYDKRKMSVADYEKLIQKGIDDDSFFDTDETSNVHPIIGRLSNVMEAFAFGSGQQAGRELIGIFGDEFKNIWNKISNEFITPMKNQLFGTKDKTGYSRDGLFSGMQNKFLDTYRQFAREFSGKGYTDSHGNKIADKGDNEESVIGNLKRFTHNTLDTIGDFILGEKITETDTNGNTVWKGKRDRKSGNWLGKAIGSLQEGFEGWKTAIFGETDEESRQTTLEDIKNKVSDMLPSAVTGGIGGAVFGGLAGSSLLGTLIGGPVGGAIMGGIGGILSKSDRFQEWLFGKDFTDENGNTQHIEGLISQRIQNAFKDNKTAIIGGAALGLGKSMIFGSGGGLLTSLVGGPFAGAIIGGSLSFLTKTNMVQKFLFGDEDQGGWHKGIVNMFNNTFRRSDTGEVSGTKLAGMNVIGALGGGLTAALVGKMGLIGAAMTPMGPIGGALIGLGLSMRASKDGFHKWLFGEDYEKDGQKRHRAGILGQFSNMLQTELFNPMKNGMENFIDDTKNFIIDKIMAPVEFALEPLFFTFKKVGDGIISRVDKISSFVGKQITGGVNRIVKTVENIIVKPLRNVFSIFFKGITGVAKTIISAPFQGLALATNFMDARARRSSRKQVMRENRENQGFLRGTLSNMAIRFHYGDAYQDASHRYVDYENYQDETAARSERQQRYREERDRRLAQSRQDRENRRNWEKNARLIRKATGGSYAEDTEENRLIAQEMYRTRKRGLFGTMFGPDELVFKGDAVDTKARLARESKEREKNKISNEDLIKNVASKDTATMDERIAANTFKTNDILGNIKNGIDKLNRNLSYSNNTTGQDLWDILKDVPDDLGGTEINNKIRSLKDKVKGMLPHFALGGISPGGAIVVGENGPEVARLPKGTNITPNNKPIPVVVKGTSESAEEYEALKKKGSYETQMKEKEKEQEKKYKRSLLTTVKDIREIASDYTGGWKGIFGKKGLITAGLITLAPIALKFLTKILNLDFGGLVSGIVNGFGDSIRNILTDMGFGLDHLGDNSTPIDKVGENADEAKSLLTGDIGGWIAPGGEIDHMSGAKVNALVHVPQYLKTGAKLLKNSSVGKAASKIVSSAKSGVNAITGVARGAKNAVTTVGNAARIVKSGSAGDIYNAAKSFKKSGVASGWKEAISMGAENAGVTLKSSGDDVTKTVSKNSKGIIKTVTECFSKLSEKLMGVIQKYAKNGSKLASYIDDIIKFLSSHASGLYKKLAPFLTKTAGLAATGVGIVLSNVTWITLGAINGATGAARLFQVDTEYTDFLMTAISTAMGALAGTTPGSILDIVNEYIVDIVGLDVFHEIAVIVYQIIASDQKYDKLMQGKQEFREEFEANEEQEWNENYQSYLSANGLSESDMSLDDFKSQANAGNIEVNLTSFADYNDQQHQTIGSRIMRGVSGIGKGVKNVISGAGKVIGGFASGVASGAKNIVSGAGRVIGGAASTIAGGAKNVVGNIGNVVGSGFSAAASGLTTFKDNIVEAIGGYQTGVNEIVANFKNTDNTLFDYLKADIKTGISDENPFKKFVDGLLTVGKVTMLPKLIISGILTKLGKGIADTFKNVAGVAVDSVKTISTTQATMTSYAIKGDIDGVKSVEIPSNEENPINGFIQGYLGLSKITNTVLGMGFKVGIGIKDAFLNVISGVANVASTIATNQSNYASMGITGDVEGLSNATAEIPEDTPISGFVSGYLGLSRMFWMIPAHIVHFGKGVASSLASAVDTAKSVGGDITSNFTEMASYIPNGDLDALYSYKFKKTEEEGILSWVVDAAGTVSRNIIGVPTAFVSLGKGIANIIGGTINTATDFVGDIKNYMSEANEYTDPDKNMSGFYSLKFGDNADDSNPVYTIVGSILQKVMDIYLGIVRGIRGIGNWFGDKFESATEFASNAKETVVNGATSVKNKITGAINTVGTKIMNLGRGGKGGRGVDLPYYSQNDPRWKNMDYGDESMGEAGCGPDAFAMVASGLGGRSNVTPVEMANYAKSKGFRDESGTSWNFVDSASRDYGLNSQKQYRPNEAFISNQLDQGHPVILSGQGGIGTPYTTGGHYVVATGKDSNGNVMINDPRGRRYSGRYPMAAVAGGANVGWGVSKQGSRGGRGLVVTGTSQDMTNSYTTSTRTAISSSSSGKDMLNGFPFLLQGDSRWGAQPYTSTGNSSQTITSSGCGITSMAMVLRSFGINVSPIDTASYSLQNGFRTENNGTSWGFFASISKKYGLTCQDLGKDTTKVSQYLDRGWPIIASMGPGTFTNGGHFIVLVGKDTNGNIVVNDPASLDKSKSSYPLSIFRNEGKNFWAFAKNGQGSINHVIDAGTLNLSPMSGESTYTEVQTTEGSPMSALNTISSFFSQFAEKALNGVLTGKWDTNYTWSNSGSSSISSTGSSTGGTTSSAGIVDVDVNNGDVEKSTRKFFIENGFTPAATAGIMGNIYQESKFNPSLLQNGKGPAAGLFQWENYTKKSGRWGGLNTYAQSKGKQWTDLKSQLEYALSEMMNESWMWKTPSNKSLTSVSSLEQFKAMTNPQDAAVAFSNHFERPGKPHNETRMSAAQKYYDQYKNEVSSSSYTSDFKQEQISGRGGRGGNSVDTSGYRFKSFSGNSNKPTLRNLAKRSHYNTEQIEYNRYSNYGGGRGDESTIVELLKAMTGFLEKISNASISSDQKLDLLEKISGSSSQLNFTSVQTGSRGENVKPIIIKSNNEQVVTPPNRNIQIAKKISYGF